MASAQVTLSVGARWYIRAVAVAAILTMAGLIVIPLPVCPLVAGVSLPAYGAAVQFALIAIAGRLLPLDSTPHRKIDLAIGGYMGLVLTLPLPLAAVAVTLCEGISQFGIVLFRRMGNGSPRRSVYAVLFGMSQHLLAVTATGLTALLPVPAPARLVLAPFVLHFTSSFLVTGVIALQRGRPFWAIWREKQVWDASTAGAVMILAIHAARAVDILPLSPIVLTAPAVVVYAALRRSAVAENAVALRDQFLTTASHELRTPLTSLRGYVQLLVRSIERGGGDPEKNARALRTVDAQATRLVALIEQLMDVTCLRTGAMAINRVRTDLGDIARNVAEALSPLAGSYRILVCGGALEAVVDPVRIEQVLTNLVHNAIKYANGGEVIEIGVERDRANVRLVVRDHGQGIPEYARERLFDRYYRGPLTDTKIPGLGIGLYVTREIAELHGGRVDVDCPSDGGTRFIVTLPDGLDNGRVRT